MSELDKPIQYLKSVGPKRAEAFNKIGFKTVRDLIFYFPYKHLDRSNILTAPQAYGYLINGYEGEVTIIARVVDKERIRIGPREILKVKFADKRGYFDAVWFQGGKYYYSVFEEGDYFAVSGKPSLGRHDELQIVHPATDKLDEEDSVKFFNTGKIIPFYSLPKELKAASLKDISLRKIVTSAVESALPSVNETLPDWIIKENDLLDLKSAVKNYHTPENVELLNRAKHRFSFEELFYIETIVALKKNNFKSKLKGTSMKVVSKLVHHFLSILSFKLTDAQLKVLSEIRHDMEHDEPMNRLLQGDVGSGKTIVALIAMLIAVDNGYQAAIMAPTEILASQHAKNFTRLLNKLYEMYPERQVKVSLLLGGQKKSAKDKSLEEIELKQADIIIGTHALFEENVAFNDLRLVVIDEQHRFGVDQRRLLQQKGIMPDVLVMSATPIPRTLTMTLYGDLDVSIINELPAQRKEIKTYLRGENKLNEIYNFIITKAKEGFQSYIVFPLVEESEKLELKAAETHYNELSTTVFKDYKVGLLHGRMNWNQKEETMLRFLHKEYDILISTTVIEVGIDVPNSTVMLINDAHRFGLSQLHQLRGRVGRGSEQSYCILVTKDELAAIKNDNINLEYLSEELIEKHKSRIRMQAMVKYTDGFKLAEIDMKLRGPGNIFGTKQSGFPELKYSDIIEDAETLIKAKQIAFKIIEDDPTLIKKENQIIKQNLHTHYSDSLKYSYIA